MNNKFRKNSCELEQAGIIDKNYGKRNKNPKRTNKIIALIISVFLVILVFMVRKKDKLKLNNGQAINKINDIEVENLDLSNFQSSHLIEMINDFTSKNASILKVEENNPVFSPLSLYISTASLAEGSEKENKDKLELYLGLDESNEAGEKIKYLIHQLYYKTDQHHLILNNSFWIDEPDLSKEKLIKKSFIKEMSNNYYGEIFLGNFKDENLINDMKLWLDSKFDGNLYEYSLNSSADNLSILSTLNYKDEWKSSFDEKNNLWAPFNGSSEDVEYMIKSETSYTSQGKDFISASLATQNGDITFIKGKDNSNLKELLDSGNLMKNIQESDQSKKIVNYQIPKINLSSFNNILKNIDNNLFSLLTENSNFNYIGDNIKLSSMSQAINLKIDENGINSKPSKSQDKSWTDKNLSSIDFILDEEFILIINENTDFGQVPLFVALINTIE